MSFRERLPGALNGCANSKGIVNRRISTKQLWHEVHSLRCSRRSPYSALERSPLAARAHRTSNSSWLLLTPVPRQSSA
jgi:hypothetical protein